MIKSLEKNHYKNNQIINEMIIQRTSDLVKNGFTIFFTKKNKIEASYYYCEDVLDLLKSSSFDPDSLAFQRQKNCILKNKKEKIKDEFKKYRFFSFDKGFYSLEELYNGIIGQLETPIERLESIKRKIDTKSFKGRYCISNVCACLGCDNHLISWKNQQEHKDFSLYMRYISRKENTYQERFPELLPK